MVRYLDEASFIASLPSEERERIAKRRAKTKAVIADIHASCEVLDGEIARLLPPREGEKRPPLF